MRQPIHLSPLSPVHMEALHALDRTTKDVRLRTRAHMMLLAAEQGMRAPTIAQIVRENEQTVPNWLKRYRAEGLEGLHGAPRLETPQKVTPAYVAQWHNVVRLRPRSLGSPSWRWTLARLADSMAEQTGIRVEAETVRRYLHEADSVS